MAHLLIADDDPAICRLLQRALSREGYTVETAGNGREALDRIRRSCPDLLLLDLMMPVMDGWELYRRLRADGYQELPIVVITAGERLSRATMELPDAELVPKPFDLDYLLEVIQRQLAG